MYSEETETTILLRKKEQEEDYGYIYEPDLLPIELNSVDIENAIEGMKRLPTEVYEEILAKYKLAPKLQPRLCLSVGFMNTLRNAWQYIKIQKT